MCAAMRLWYLPAHFEREIKIDGLDCGTILERRKCIEREREKEKGEKEVKKCRAFSHLLLKNPRSDQRKRHI